MLTSTTKFEEATTYIDPANALEHLSGNRKVYRVLLHTFLQNPAWDDAVEALGNGEIDLAAALIKSIRCVSVNLFLTTLHHHALQLEMQLQNGVIDQQAVDRFTGHWDKTRHQVYCVLEGLENGAVWP